MQIDTIRMLDVRTPETVEVVISGDGKKLWVNVNGLCVLRIQGTPVVLNDWRALLALTSDHERVAMLSADKWLNK
jgi:hypothetical protein